MLKLPGRINVAPDTEHLFDDLAKALMGCAAEAVAQRDVFHVALSGGGTPQPFYESLVIDPRYRGLPWDKTHVWIVDERCVPEDHEKSNIRMIRESLTEHTGMSAEQVHPMPVLADDPAGDYENEMRGVFGEEMDLPRIDFMLLGMGGDCHTASLFPKSPAQYETGRWIACNDGELVVPPPRVTMTYPLINAARHIGVLVVGESKFEALQHVAEQNKTGQTDIANIPISGVQPVGGELVWYVDEAAVGA